MKLTKRGPVWWVDFRMPDGRRRRLSTGERDEAAAHLRAGTLVQGAMADAVAAPQYPGVTLGRALEQTYVSLWGRSKSATVMRRTVDVIAREIGWWPLEAVDYGKLEAYCRGLLDAGKAPATVNRRMSAVGVALREAVRRKELPARPDLPHYTENNRRERYMTEAEEAALLAWLERRAAAEAILGGTEWAYVRNLAVFLLDTGFRFSEAFKFTLVGTEADLGGTVSKSGRGRRVPLTRRAAVAAAGLLSSPHHAALATNPNAHAWVDHRWKQAVAGAGCPDVTLHILRHTCASRLIQRGVDIYTVSKWLGHSSVKVTERYAKLAPDTLSRALAALDRQPVPVGESPRDTEVLPNREHSTDRGTVRACK